MKVLNLYAGIGGNRKLWDNVEVTAVEIEPEIAEIYQDFFPDDIVIIGDAHQYLLDHYTEFDFIWSSPPCFTHSKANIWLNPQGHIRYPNMNLYQEIIFLQQWCKSLYCVENVQGYYEPLIKPQLSGRHYFWANFHITDMKTPPGNISKAGGGIAKYWIELYGFDISKYKLHDLRKDQIYRNCVFPPLGKHVLECARGKTVIPLTEFTEASIRE